jgi:hypothetical protein
VTKFAERNLLQMLTFAELVKKYSAIYGSQRLIPYSCKSASDRETELCQLSPNLYSLLCASYMIKTKVRSYFLPTAGRNEINYDTKTFVNSDSSTMVAKSLFEARPWSTSSPRIGYSFSAVTL